MKAPRCRKYDRLPGLLRTGPFLLRLWPLRWTPGDLWVGLFWKTESIPFAPSLHLYLCLIPTWPIHLEIIKPWEPEWENE